MRCLVHDGSCAFQFPECRPAGLSVTIGDDMPVTGGEFILGVAEKAGRTLIADLRNPRERARLIGSFSLCLFVAARRPATPFPALVLFGLIGAYAGGQLYDIREDLHRIALAAGKTDDGN